MKLAKKVLLVVLTLTLIIGLLAGCSAKPAQSASNDQQPTDEQSKVKKERVYYYVGVNHGHPYWYDVHQGFEYAAEQYGVKVVKAGPDTYDPKSQAEALEQTIIKKPDGIITAVFDASMLPGIKKAMSEGIPVVVIESTLPNSDALSFVGLDAYASGEDTAEKLIELSGTSGNLVIMGNWGAANTDQKLAGLKDYLAKNSNWKVIAELDDKAVTEAAIEAAKSAFNNYKDMTAIVGLDSSGGPAIGAAMEELSIAPGSVTVVCHDREDTAIEYIEKGYIQASIIAKSASMPWLALGILENYNNNGGDLIPLSADNIAAGINAVPEFCATGSACIDKNNVEFFKRDIMKRFDSKNYE